MLVLYTRNDSIDEKTRNKNLVISFFFICFLLINLETSFDCVICISDDVQSSQQNQSNLALASRDDSPFCDTATFWDRQYHSIPRNIVEQPSSSSKRHVLAQSPLPVAMSQWEQLLNLQLLHHHVQQSHLLSQSTIPFCLPHLYGYRLPVTSYQEWMHLVFLDHSLLLEQLMVAGILLWWVEVELLWKTILRFPTWATNLSTHIHSFQVM